MAGKINEGRRWRDDISDCDTRSNRHELKVKKLGWRLSGRHPTTKEVLMYIYSGDCRFCETGIQTPYRDDKGRRLFTGDIVLVFTDDYGPENLTVMVRNDFTSYQGGRHEQNEDVGNPFAMGIADCKPVNKDSETIFVSDDTIWHVRKLKDHKDVVDGEHWRDFGFNYRSV